MRDFAIDLLKDSVETEVVASEEAIKGSASSTPLNPLVLGLPAFLIGVPMMFLFPAVGVLLLALGSLACLIGVVMAIAQSLRGRGESGA